MILVWGSTLIIYVKNSTLSNFLLKESFASKQFLENTQITKEGFASKQFLENTQLTKESFASKQFLENTQLTKTKQFMENKELIVQLTR